MVKQTTFSFCLDYRLLEEVVRLAHISARVFQPNSNSNEAVGVFVSDGGINFYIFAFDVKQDFPKSLVCMMNKLTGVKLVTLVEMTECPPGYETVRPGRRTCSPHSQVV